MPPLTPEHFQISSIQRQDLGWEISSHFHQKGHALEFTQHQSRPSAVYEPQLMSEGMDVRHLLDQSLAHHLGDSLACFYQVFVPSAYLLSPSPPFLLISTPASLS